MAGVKRGRGRGNLGARARGALNSLPLPFRTPATQAKSLEALKKSPVTNYLLVWESEKSLVSQDTQSSYINYV